MSLQCMVRGWEYRMAYQPTLSGFDIKRHLWQKYKLSVDHLYHGSNEVYDSDFLEELHILPGATLHDVRGNAAWAVTQGTIEVMYQRLGHDAIALEIPLDWTVEQVADQIGELEGTPRMGLRCLLFSATALLYRGNIGCTTKTPIGDLGICAGDVLYPHFIPSDLSADYLKFSLGDLIFDESVFWQPCVKQSPLALAVFLSTLNSLYLDLKNGPHSLGEFLEVVQRRIDFPPVSLAFQHLFKGEILNAEKHVISEVVLHLTRTVQPHVTMDDILFRNVPLVFEALMKDLEEHPLKLPPIPMTPMRKMTTSARNFIRELEPAVADAMAREDPPDARLKKAHFEEFPMCEKLLDSSFNPSLHGIYGADAKSEPLLQASPATMKLIVAAHVCRFPRILRKSSPNPPVTAVTHSGDALKDGTEL